MLIRLETGFILPPMKTYYVVGSFSIEAEDERQAHDKAAAMFLKIDPALFVELEITEE